jgi:hypothetical protein
MARQAATASCSPSHASLFASSSCLALHLELSTAGQLCRRAHLRGPPPPRVGVSSAAWGHRRPEWLVSIAVRGRRRRMLGECRRMLGELRGDGGGRKEGEANHRSGLS